MTDNQTALREALEPCQFCGGEAEIERRGTARQSMIVACTNCGARMESGDVVGMTGPENYAWNTRSALASPEAGGETANSSNRHACGDVGAINGALSHEQIEDEIYEWLDASTTVEHYHLQEVDVRNLAFVASEAVIGLLRRSGERTASPQVQSPIESSSRTDAQQKHPGAGAEPATSVRHASGSDQVGRTGGSIPPTGATPPQPSAGTGALVTCAVTGAVPGDGGACGDCDPCIFGEASVPPAVKRLIAEKNSLINQVGELSDRIGNMEEAALSQPQPDVVREALVKAKAALIKYEGDVDMDAPPSHRELMREIDAALAPAPVAADGGAPPGAACWNCGHVDPCDERCPNDTSPAPKPALAVSRDDLARAFVHARAPLSANDENWPLTLAHYKEMCAEYPDFASGGSVITDAFRDADIALAILSRQPAADLVGALWHPFETAPKTGSPFLCFVPDEDCSDETGIEIIWWEPQEGAFLQNGEPIICKPTLWTSLDPLLASLRAASEAK